jgi:hypothetical protein
LRTAPVRMTSVLAAQFAVSFIPRLLPKMCAMTLFGDHRSAKLALFGKSGLEFGSSQWNKNIAEMYSMHDSHKSVIEIRIRIMLDPDP